MREISCANCGVVFKTSSGVRKYCKQTKVRPCPICGKPYTYICKSKMQLTCNSTKCIAQIGFVSFNKSTKSRKCRVCNKEFIPQFARQLDCNLPIIKNCTICGKPFNDICQLYHKQVTCGSTDCMNMQKVMSVRKTLSQTPRQCAWCGESFVAEHPSQIYCGRDHYNNCVICGKHFMLPKIKQRIDIRQTCSKDCSNKLKFIDGSQNSPSARKKKDATCLEKYGYIYPSQSELIKQKIQTTFRNRTGYDHPYHSPAIRSKAAKSACTSKLEQKVSMMLDSCDIEYMTQYSIADEHHCHAFDFYIPKYKILIDADGIYYHGYLSDADGKHVRDDYDDVRLTLIPKDHMFFVVVEKQEEDCVDQIVSFIRSDGEFAHQYDSDLFVWCRKIGFPYPHYSDDRLQKDFRKLQAADVSKYNPYSKIAESTIRHFHKSVYDAYVNGHVSIKAAWEDDILLRQIIANRLIYKNDADASKILAGVGISDICPKVTMFNPILGRYLTVKYLHDFSEVFDPFSGFSGRLLGVTSADKYYIGSDLNEMAVDESNQIIRHFGLNAIITHKDIFDYPTTTYQSLLTCPPYADKEIYSTETVFMSCDSWIDYILEHFQCNRYVFVVDSTEKYISFVTEEINTSSHLNNTKEKVIVIDK